MVQVMAQDEALARVHRNARLAQAPNMNENGLVANRLAAIANSGAASSSAGSSACTAYKIDVMAADFGACV
jgi:hypothetical protein